MTLLEKEKEIEIELSKHQLMPFLRDKVKELPVPFDTDLETSIAKEILAYMLFYKRTIPPVLIGLLYKRFANVQLCLKVLDSLIVADYLDFNENNQIVTRFTLNKEDTEKLSKMMYPLPMVMKPNTLKRNSDNGYYFLPRSSVVLRTSFYKGYVNLSHLNRVNSIPLRINQAVLDNRTHVPKKDIPNVKDKANWNKYVRQQREVVESYKDITFYLTHKYDKRGRVYCQGYHISYQSDDFTNALVEFADGEKVI